jgi:hypothetical protein
MKFTFKFYGCNIWFWRGVLPPLSFIIYYHSSGLNNNQIWIIKDVRCFLKKRLAAFAHHVIILGPSMSGSEQCFNMFIWWVYGIRRILQVHVCWYEWWRLCIKKYLVNSSLSCCMSQWQKKEVTTINNF